MLNMLNMQCDAACSQCHAHAASDRMCMALWAVDALHQASVMHVAATHLQAEFTPVVGSMVTLCVGSAEALVLEQQLGVLLNAKLDEYEESRARGGSGKQAGR